MGLLESSCKAALNLQGSISHRVTLFMEEKNIIIDKFSLTI